MLSSIIHALSPIVEQPHLISYLIVFFSAFLESIVGIAMLLPGSTIVLIFGALSAHGYFSIKYIMLFAIAGALLGDNTSYYFGKKYGRKWMSKGIWFIKKSHFELVEKFFLKHGAKSIFLGRFIPSVKEVAPFIAGSAHMKQSKFIFWNFLGSIGWSIEWAGTGYIFAQSLNLAQAWLTRVGFIFAALLIIFLFSYIIKFLIEKYGKQIFSSFIYALNFILNKAINHRWFVWFRRKTPKLFKLIKNRTNIHNFYGFPLTMLSIAFIYVFVIFSGIVNEVLKSKGIVNADIRILNLFAVFRDPSLTTIFYWITLLGKWENILVFSLATIIILLLWKKRLYIIPLIVSTTGSALFVYFSKIIIHRPRPSVAMYVENSYSFPSGHANIAIAFYGFLAYILIQNSKKWNSKINTLFISIMIILLIGLSRLYLGVHYLSDVAGGYLIGALWLIIGISIAESSRYKNNSTVNKIRIKSGKTIATAVIIASLLFYSIFAIKYSPIETIKKEKNIYVVNNITSIFKNTKLKYTETITGKDQVPISFVIIAKNNIELFNAFRKSGWDIADPLNIYSLARSAKAVIMKEPYKNAPMTPSFWKSNINDIGIQRESDAKIITQRHHARFWNTNYVTENGYRIYVGSASFDMGLKWEIIHKINPNIDAEREYLFKTMENAGVIKSFKIIQSVKPYEGTNLFGDVFYTDGKQYIIFLK